MLGNKIKSVISKCFLGESKITVNNSKSALKNIRNILLESGVGYRTASSIVDGILEDIKSEKSEKLKTSIENNLLLMVHERIVKEFGNVTEHPVIELGDDPVVIMLFGLQGHGKTTSVGKIVHFIKSQKASASIMVSCCDNERPAGDIQLQMVSEKSGATFIPNSELTIIDHAKNSLAYAKHSCADVLIIDTAGRQQIDKDRMTELNSLCTSIKVDLKFLVLSAQCGKESFNIASMFDDLIGIDRIFVSMMDSSAKLGSILSLGHSLCKKIKLEGIGEKTEDYQAFNAISASDRILGRGDIINLTKALKDKISEEEKQDIMQKMQSGKINFDDIEKIIKMMGRFGAVSRIFEMMGVADKKKRTDAEQQIKISRALIRSMTKKERDMSRHLSVSIKNRIIKGSGRSLEELNKLISMIDMTKKMKGILSNPAAMSNIQNMMKGNNFGRR
ncbi:MAG: signal recognition particle receptor subunit alpha [Chlamydiia bacterium]|nr:signal recognition particle receptor subunit alpha [Chlamydiia bacterium]